MGFIANAWLTANVVMSWVDNARTKKDIQRIYKQTAEANYLNRAVLALPHIDKMQLRLTSAESTDDDIYEYRSKSLTPAIDYIWGESVSPESIIVSGGSTEERTRALMPFVRKAQQEDIPIIALHAGNNDLEPLIRDNSVVCEFVSRDNLYYDPFRSSTVDDIAFLLYENMPDDDASPNAEALFRSLAEIVLRTEGKVTFHSLSAFPLADLMDRLNSLKAINEVTADEFKNISRDYMAGSSEINAVRSYMNKLNRQAESVFGKATSSTCNVKKMINMKGVIAIDVGVGSNDLIQSFIINQLLFYQTAGKNFAILIDGLTLSRFSLIDIFRGRTFAVSHNDFISALHGGDKTCEALFAEITGNVNSIVLFNHKSGTSCQKWSEHLGKYHKIRIKMNISQHNSLFTGGNTRGISVDEADEPRVRADTISMLPVSLACIHNSNGTLFAEI